MNYLFPLVISAAFIFPACETPLNNTPDPAIPVTDTSKKIPAIPDSIPHEVHFGNNQTYAYMPDSCFNELILGNPKSFKNFRRENGATMMKLSGERKFMAWYNIEKTEELEAYVTGNESKGYFPYKFILQKAGQKHGHPFPEKHEYVNKANFITGHGIYIGMSPDYVLNIYKSQSLMQWQKGDTLYLQYQPKEKDSKYYTRYKRGSYTATYKFVNGFLRRIEYAVTPEEFEKQ